MCLVEKFTIMCKPELATINQRDEYIFPKSDSFNPLFVRPNKPRHCQRST